MCVVKDRHECFLFSCANKTENDGAFRKSIQKDCQWKDIPNLVILIYRNPQGL